MAAVVLALRSIPSVPVPASEQQVSMLWLVPVGIAVVVSGRLFMSVLTRRWSENLAIVDEEKAALYQAIRWCETEIAGLKRRIEGLEGEE
jgi:hypothetical protein